MAGPPTSVAVEPVPGYPNVDNSMEPDDAPDYRGQSVLAVKGKIYQFVCTLDRASDRLRHWNAAKLIYSDDGGKSWRNQDGSSPVQFTGWNQQSRSNLAFFNEPDGCFSLLSFLQMGRDYSANQDGYAYVYSPNGNVDGLVNQLMMFRVPVDDILDRKSYEYFGGLTGQGAPVWKKDMASRQPVHVFPRGWVNSAKLMPHDIEVETWLPSVVYNKPLGVYMMVSTGTGCAPDETEFGRPNYFGFWVSETPWGPWRQIHEDRAWTPGGDIESRPYSVQIAPGWIAPDGKSFWLVWADMKGIRNLNESNGNSTDNSDEGAGKTPHADSAGGSAEEPDLLAEVEMMCRVMPGYGFNAKRVDLDFA